MWKDIVDFFIKHSDTITDVLLYTVYLVLLLGVTLMLLLPIVKSITELVLHLIKFERKSNKLIVAGSSFLVVFVFMFVAYLNLILAAIVFGVLLFTKVAMEIVIYKNYQSSIAILGAVAIGAVYLIGLMFASNIDFVAGKEPNIITVSGFWMQFFEAGIFTFYILLVISLLGILFLPPIMLLIGKIFDKSSNEIKLQEAI